MEANWTDPFLFAVYSVVKPLAGTLILVFMYLVITGGETDNAFFSYMYVGNAMFMYAAEVLFGITWVIHDDREHYMTLKQVYIAPINFYAYILGRSAIKIAITTAGVIITLAFGVIALGVDISLGDVDWLLLVGSLVLGMSCICVLGLFDRFYFMSGHGGNMSFLVNIVKYAGERHRRIFCATAFLHTAGRIGSAALDKYRTSPIGGMGHACELETSYLLHLRPDLCHMERVVDEVDFVATPDYYMDWIEGGSLIANPPWDDDSKTGAYGAGSHASAEKGRLWLEAAVQEKVGHVAEIHEQHRRREERRIAGFGLWVSMALTASSIPKL